MSRIATLLLLLASGVPATAEVREATFESKSLGRSVGYVVQLPPSYGKDTSRRYPVVYALHGLFESRDFWTRRGLAPVLDRLMADGTIPEMIIVAVDGDDSFFVNGPLGRYEDLVTRDIVAVVESEYRVRPGRAGRGLLGVSMGGYAALRIGLSQPGLFRAVATHSAMLLQQPPPARRGGFGQANAFALAFGEPVDPKLWAAADPFTYAETVDPKAAPALYLDCGSEDRYGLAAGHRALDAKLTARGVAHQFALHPGDHGYAYVLTVLDRSLRFLGRALE